MKFVVILLLVDITVGLALVYQFDQGNISPIDSNICEQADSYTLTGSKWGAFPIKYYVHSGFPNEFLSVIDDAFDVWDSISSSNVFDKVSNALGANLEVEFTQTINPEALGEASNLVSIATGLIQESTLHINPSKDWKILDFSCKLLPIDHVGPFDMEAVLIHEIGHILGLGHVNDAFSSLYVYYSGTFQKTLSTGEIDGFSRLYGS